MFRVHQFDKVEMFVFCLPESSAGAARVSALGRGGARRRARHPLPGRQRRRRRPGRRGDEEVRHRGVVPEPGALPRDHVDLEHDRLPGAPPRRPLPREDGGLEPVHTLNGTAVTASVPARDHGELPGRGAARMRFPRCSNSSERPEKCPPRRGYMAAPGGVPEWLKGAVLKTARRREASRGFPPPLQTQISPSFFVRTLLED